MTQRRRLLVLPILLAFAAGCTQFPALDRTQTPDVENADYPALIPIEPIVAQARAEAPIPEQIESTLNARLAALRARANRLRGPVLAGRERQRLAQGLQ